MTSLSIPSCQSIRRFGLMLTGFALFTTNSAAAQLLSSARAGASPSPVSVTLASVIVPGAGQIIMRQRRAVAYLALEAVGLSVYIAQSRDGRRNRKTYRNLSRDVARAAFSPNGPRGNWDYFERMEKFVESGVFDRIAGGNIEPETDVETYNGSVWLLARETFWRDPHNPPPVGSPEYNAAIDFYESRAASDDMRWSWRDNPAEFQKFRSAISGSNSAFQSARATASLVLANHFLSAVDAYVSVRMRVHRTADGAIAFTGSIPFGY